MLLISWGEFNGCVGRNVWGGFFGVWFGDLDHELVVRTVIRFEGYGDFGLRILRVICCGGGDGLGTWGFQYNGQEEVIRRHQDVRIDAASQCGSDHYYDGSGEGEASGRHEGASAVEEEERCAHDAVPADFEADCGNEGVDGGHNESVRVFVD